MKALGSVTLPDDRADAFTNRGMRALNHEHAFRLPLAGDNGLDLDRITDGLARAAEDLKADVAYVGRVYALGSRYLEDGASLVHGDYFPESWMRAAGGIRIIDPEFCFLGAREFDHGVMLAHLALARTHADPAERVIAATRRSGSACSASTVSIPSTRWRSSMWSRRPASAARRFRIEIQILPDDITEPGMQETAVQNKPYLLVSESFKSSPGRALYCSRPPPGFKRDLLDRLLR